MPAQHSILLEPSMESCTTKRLKLSLLNKLARVIPLENSIRPNHEQQNIYIRNEQQQKNLIKYQNR